jgi:hypothetical protein
MGSRWQSRSQRPETHSAHRLSEPNARRRCLVCLHSSRLGERCSSPFVRARACARSPDPSRNRVNQGRLDPRPQRSRHTRWSARHELCDRSRKARQVGARKPVWPSLLFSTPLARKRPDEDRTFQLRAAMKRPAEKKTRNQHPFHRHAGKSRTLSTSRTRTCWPLARGVSRAWRQDDSPLNQQTTNARRHPMDPVESSKTLLESGLAAVSERSPSGPRGGLPPRSSRPSPPFMVFPKGTTREARLEWLPTLRWLRREVGPCHGYPKLESSDSYLTPGRG